MRLTNILSYLLVKNVSFLTNVCTAQLTKLLNPLSNVMDQTSRETLQSIEALTDEIPEIKTDVDEKRALLYGESPLLWPDYVDGDFFCDEHLKNMVEALYDVLPIISTLRDASLLRDRIKNATTTLLKIVLEMARTELEEHKRLIDSDEEPQLTQAELRRIVSLSKTDLRRSKLGEDFSHFEKGQTSKILKFAYSLGMINFLEAFASFLIELFVTDFLTTLSSCSKPAGKRKSSCLEGRCRRICEDTGV